MATKKDIVSEENFEDLLLKSANEALEYSKNERELTTHLASLIQGPPEFSKEEIKNIRRELGVSQPVFAQIFGESLSAIRQWEQGNRNMSKSARRLLDLIKKDPKGVLELITHKKEAS